MLSIRNANTEFEVFHIAGKPGAGKSTLMRYLYKSPTTRNLLQMWSGEDGLVLAKYFFWKFDSHQNRLIGLKRSILYAVLHEPDITTELMHLLFPNQIGQGASHLEREQQLSINDDDVELAFSNLISTKAGLIGRKFCFFLDALDEFDQETAREDYVDLVLLIQQWAEESDARVKIVVSSREFPEFQGFDEGQRIRLHLYTLGDMRIIVRDRLQSHPQFKRLKWLDKGANVVPGHQNIDDAAHHLTNAESFIDYIATAAEGVFLWSVLVVKELRKGLSRGDSIRKLYSKVAGAPKDLKKFFESIIETIDDAYQREAIILFAIVLRLSSSHSAGLGLIECSFFLEAADASVMDPAQWEPDVDGSSIDERKDLAEIQITGRFNGLLETSPDNTSVKFLHSSILEVMERYTSQGLKKHNLTEAQIDNWLCSIILAWVRWALKGAALVDGVIDFNMLAVNMKSLLSGLPRQTDNKTMEILDKIDTTLLLTWQKSPWQDLDEWSKAEPCRRSGFIKPNAMTAEVYSLLFAAAELGRADYLSWKLKEMGATHRNGAFASLLLHYLSTFSLKPAILQEVLDKGISVNCTSYRKQATAWSFSRPHYAWHEYLANVLSPPLRSRIYNPHEYCHLWEMIEVWLRNGADYRFWIGIGKNKFGLDRLEAYQSSAEGKIVRFAYLFEFGDVLPDAEARLFPRSKPLAGLRDLVAFISPHNRDALLELLSRT